MVHSGDDDIQMVDLDDVHDGPASKTERVVKPDELGDEDGDQDVESSLLGSHTRTRGMERSVQRPNMVKLWPQVKGIVAEVVPTLLFTTLGLLCTGKLLDQVSHWNVMKQAHQLIIIIPVVMNLKGNLEMNLSARLGTAANVGDLDDPATRRSMILGNLALLQVQATIISFIAACIALLIGLALPRFVPAAPSTPVLSQNSTTTLVGHTLLKRRPIPLRPDYSAFSLRTLVVVSSTAMTAAAVSSILLGSFMCTLIVLCRKFGRDPDNIAPPVASFLGDLVTLCCIGLTSAIIVPVIDTYIPLLVGLMVFTNAAICLVATSRNVHVRPLLTYGWSPLFGAMIISCCTGVLLDQFVSQFEGYALLAVVVSGLPGAVGCILASRLSTALHATALAIATSDSSTKHIASPRLVMITLTLIALPIEVAFIITCHAFGWLRLPALFLFMPIALFFVAVVLSLIIASALTRFLWSKGYDPDTYALPTHSAVMDLIGQLLLAACYKIMSKLLKTITIQG